jgi:hypothetical protein
VAAERVPGDGFDLELVVHGPDLDEETPDLAGMLTAAGAGRVDRLFAGAPPPGKRDAAILTELTLAVGGVANLVTVIDTVARWLTERRAQDDQRETVSPEKAIPSVTITSGACTLTLTDPPDWVQSRAVNEFLREHGQERAES